jgi:hypothetical protein
MAYRRASLAFIIAAVVAGGAAGAIDAAVVSLTGPTGLVATIAIAGILLVVLALGATGVLIPVLQRDVETPRQWVDEGRYHWALKTGVALGFGASTRLGFWSWYLIPTAAAASGSVLAGALIWGTYALVRTCLGIGLGRGRFENVRALRILPMQLLTGYGLATHWSDLVGVIAAATLLTSVAVSL